MENLDLKKLINTNGGSIADSSTWGNLADATFALFPSAFGKYNYTGVLLTDNMKEYLKIDHSKINAYA